jgi:hypothetical protein
MTAADYELQRTYPAGPISPLLAAHVGGRAMTFRPVRPPGLTGAAAARRLGRLGRRRRDISAIVAGAVVELPPQVITRHQTARPPGTPATT